MTQPTTQPTTEAILVPLDGSDMSEFAVPYAAAVAAALGVPALVTRIVERTRWSSVGSGYLIAPREYAELMELATQDAQAQTQRVTEGLRARGVAARSLVEEATSPAVLLEIQRREHVALVVMATHARTGLARTALGSVADQLVREGSCPTLLLRARGRLSEQPALERALIPLDGSALSELALTELNRLAGRLVKRVTLAQVIDAEARGGASREAARTLEATRQRIERDVAELRGQVETLLLWGPPAQQVLEESARHDLIIMATHGAGGAARWAFGSVASEVASETLKPLLLVRPQRHQT